MKINNIVIFCPSRITGGHEYLSVRLADAIYEMYPQYNLYYCDYPDGFSHNKWSLKNVIYIDYEGKDKPIRIPSHSAVIAQLNLISEPKRFIVDRENSFFIYWFLHSLNIKFQVFAQGRYFITKSERKALGKELKLLSEFGVVKCASYGAYAQLIKDFYQKPQVFSWLPNIAPIKKSNTKPLFERVSSDEIKFCWLGRLDEEKARNILTYMNELEALNKTKKLSLSLIGLGPAEEMLKQEAKKYNYTIRFIGEKRDEDLDTFIREESEIGLASGTSAFEFSLRGKPVIMEWVIDRVYKAGELKNYIFTEEEEDYDYSSGFELKRNGEGSFVEKLNEILNDYGNVAKKSYDFVMSKSADNCAKALLRTIDGVSNYSQKEICLHTDMACEIIRKGRNRISFFRKLRSLFGRQ